MRLLALSLAFVSGVALSACHPGERDAGPNDLSRGGGESASASAGISASQQRGVGLNGGLGASSGTGSSGTGLTGSFPTRNASGDFAVGERSATRSPSGSDGKR